MVKVYHTKESLKSRFICQRRKISNGRGVLGKRMDAGTGEAVAEELTLGNSKLAFAQAIDSA